MFDLQVEWSVLRSWIANLSRQLDPAKKLAIQEKGSGSGMVKKTISKEGRHIVSITQFLNVFDDWCLTGFPKIH